MHQLQIGWNRICGHSYSVLCDVILEDSITFISIFLTDLLLLTSCWYLSRTTCQISSFVLKHWSSPIILPISSLQEPSRDGTHMSRDHQPSKRIHPHWRFLQLCDLKRRHTNVPSQGQFRSWTAAMGDSTRIGQVQSHHPHGVRSVKLALTSHLRIEVATHITLETWELRLTLTSHLGSEVGTHLTHWPLVDMAKLLQIPR